MKTTIFNTALITPFLRFVTRFFLRVTGWRVAGEMPNLPKFVVIGAPHTSNWDFLLLLAVGFILRANLHFMGKAELFRQPFGFFFYWCGGIPVDRKKSTGLVEQVSKIIQQSQYFILAIAPEGTRHKVREWKSGFYHIAKSANTPVVFAYVDGKRKVAGIGDTFILTHDMEADMKIIQTYYAKFEGINQRQK